MTCSASNAHISLLPYFQKESKFNVQHHYENLKSKFNVTSIQLWHPFTAAFPNFSYPELPKPLKSMKMIPMPHFISELHDATNIDNSWPHWHILSSGIGFTIGIIVILICCAKFIRVRLRRSKGYANGTKKTKEYSVVTQMVSARAEGSSMPHEENHIPTPGEVQTATSRLVEPMRRDEQPVSIYPMLRLSSVDH